MPTANEAFPAVAAWVGGIDPDDKEAVDRFYLSRYPEFPAAAREIISDFLIASVTRPEERDLELLAGRVRHLIG